MRRSPMAALATLALLLGTAATATAARPPRGDAPLMPGTKAEPTAVVTPDAVYTLSDAPGRRSETQLFTRSLSADATTVELGAPTFIGRASGYSMAEHDGSLAYTAWDGHLALRAPDGSQTRPAWGADEAFNLYGTTSMSSRWLVAGHFIFDLASGAKHDMAGLMADALVDYPSVGVFGLEVVDDRAVWYASTYDEGAFEHIEGVFTVELGLAGPVGEPIMLDGGSWGTVHRFPASFTDQAIVWVTVSNEWDWETWEVTTTSSVRWVDLDAVGEPFTEAIIGPAQWADGAWTYGDKVAVSFGSHGAFGGGLTTLREIDLANLAAGEQTVPLTSFDEVLDINGPLIAWASADGKTWLTDTLARQFTVGASSPGAMPRGPGSPKG